MKLNRHFQPSRFTVMALIAGVVLVGGPMESPVRVDALGPSFIPRLVAGGGQLGHSDGSPAVCPGASGCAGTQDGKVNYPLGMAVHPVSGEFFFSQGAFENNADLNDQYKSIRVIDSGGNLLTVLGDNNQSSACTSSCDGPATTSSQQLRGPGHMVFNSSGTELYVVDSNNGVRMVSFSGTPARPSSISTLSYTSLPTGFDSISDLVTFGGIALDTNGDLYFGGANFNSGGDYHRSVFKRTAAGVLTELFTTSGANGTTQLNGGNAFSGPRDVKLVNDKLYIAFPDKVVRSSKSGTIEAVYNVSGEVRSVAVIGSTVYVGLTTEGVVKSFTDNAVDATATTPSLTALLGTSSQTFAIGSTQGSVELTGPRSMMVADGNLYISDMKSLFSAIIALEAPPAGAPTISSQPQGTSKYTGESLTLTVTASSSDGGALSYQWKKDGVDISGATSASLTISSLILSDAGSYTVVVTNTLGTSTANVMSSSAVIAVTAAPVVTTTTTTTTTVPAVTTIATTTVPAVTTTTTSPVINISSVAAPTLVTPANQAQLEADPGKAVAIIDGKSVQVETIKVETTTADPKTLRDVANEIVNAIEAVLPKGTSSGISVVNTGTGAELSGLMVNPDDPTEKLNVPVESVTLLKAGESAILISALNQTNLPAEIAPGGVLQVTRGGLVAATAYGLPGSETGEIVLMSTPRLLQTFTVDSNGSFRGQVPLPKNISFGSHTVVMATKSAKVSLGIKLVRTRMQFRIKRKISSRIFMNRAGVVKAGGGKVTVQGAGRCRANSKRVIMAPKPGGCYITVRQAAKGTNKAIFYRFTVSVVKKLPKKPVIKKK